MLHVHPYIATYIHISQISNLYTPDSVSLALFANNILSYYYVLHLKTLYLMHIKMAKLTFENFLPNLYKDG